MTPPHRRAPGGGAQDRPGRDRVGGTAAAELPALVLSVVIDAAGVPEPPRVGSAAGVWVPPSRRARGKAAGADQREGYGYEACQPDLGDKVRSWSGTEAGACNR